MGPRSPGREFFLGWDNTPGSIANSVPLCPQYFVFLLLILTAQVTVGVLFYFNSDKVSSHSTASG